MLDQELEREVNAAATTTRTIVFALANGVLVFGAYVLFLGDEVEQPTLGMLTYASLGMGAICGVLAFVIPKMIVRNSRLQLTRQATDDSSGDHSVVSSLAQVYQTTTIIGCALLEGTAFLALVAYLLEGHLASLTVAVVMLIGIALHMPLGDRLATWVDTQLRAIKEEKQLGAPQ